jgi:hypothetical protein
MVTPPMTMWDYMLWGSLLAQVVVVILAVRAYRLYRTRPFALLLLACIFLVITRSSWFVLPFSAGLSIPQVEGAQRASVMRWSDHIDVGFQVLSFIFFVAALLAFIREHRANATQTI